MAQTFLERAAALAAMDTRALVGRALAEAAADTPNLAALYADVGRRFDLSDFKSWGGYCLDVGIAEQSMIGVAAGLCAEGMRPVAITYAPFITGRVFDQIKANIGEMGLPLVLVGSTAGLSKGDLGPLLMCTDDMAMLRTIPGLSILCPADAVETVECLKAAIQAEKPAYIRLTGGKTMQPVYREAYGFEIGHAVSLREGQRILVLTTGAVTVQALAAADCLAAEGQPVAVLNMHTVKPLDTAALERYMDFDAFVTVEEHSVYGGLGSAVAEYLANKQEHPQLLCIGAPDHYFTADLYENLLAEAGLSAEALYTALRGLL